MFGTGLHFGLLVCIQACQPHMASCQVFHPCNAWVYLAQFLGYLLSSSAGGTTTLVPQSTQSSTRASSNSATLLPLALEKVNHGAHIFRLSQHCVFVGPSLHLLGCLQGNTLSKHSMSKRRLPGIGTTVGV